MLMLHIPFIYKVRTRVTTFLNSGSNPCHNLILVYNYKNKSPSCRSLKTLRWTIFY